MAKYSYFPKKFEKLLETKKIPVALRPNEAELTFAVCGVEQQSCGWSGWILHVLVRRSGKDVVLLPSDDSWKCPRCRMALFRTAASLLFRLDKKKPVVIDSNDFDTVPIKYVEHDVSTYKHKKNKNRRPGNKPP